MKLAQQVIKPEPWQKCVARVDNDTITLLDRLGPRAGVLAVLSIVKPNGECRTYQLRKTANGKYLLNV